MVERERERGKEEGERANRSPMRKVSMATIFFQMIFPSEEFSQAELRSNAAKAALRA